MKLACVILLVVLRPCLADDSRPDLARHMVEQLSSRTNGNSASFTGPTDGSNWFRQWPTNTPNFWLRDVTNILAMSQGRMDGLRVAGCANYLTPLSPHICIGAAHTGGGEGTTSLWLLPDGGYYQNKVIASLCPTNAGDIILMFMAKTNWTHVKIFPNATAQLKYWQQAVASNTVPVFIRFHQGIGRTNEFHSTFVSGSGNLGTFGHLAGQFEFGDYSKGDSWVGGDSASAAYAIVQNEAVLVCTANYGGGGPPVANYTNQVNAAMAALCASNGVPVEKLTLYDLSGFRTYANQ
jgi:hypothetical protein